jgi:Homing endonuclease associated repeat
VSRDEIIAAVRECARKLDRPPSLPELARLGGVSKGKLRRHFRGIGEAIRAAGLELDPVGLRTSTSALLKDWAAVARKLGKLPSRNYYRRHGRYCANSINLRFGAWALVPLHFLHFCRESGTEAHWEDVLGLVTSKLRLARAEKHAAPVEALPVESQPGTSSPPSLSGAKAGTEDRGKLSYAPPQALLPGRPVAGAPLSLPGLSHEPANEAGVLFLFGMMAHRLGFRVTSLQSAFPDCEAMRELQPGKWQHIRVEFEFLSRNFKEHGHNPELCDVIVCWVHNWPECPLNLNVVELSRVVREQ